MSRHGSPSRRWSPLRGSGRLGDRRWRSLAVVLLIVVAQPRRRGRAPRALALCCSRSPIRPSPRGPRAARTSVAVVVVDKSPSQSFGDRASADRSGARGAAPSGSAASRPRGALRRGRRGRRRTDGTRLFAALSNALADVPPDRVAGAILVTDGRVHDVPAEAASARLRRAGARADHRPPERARPPGRAGDRAALRHRRPAQTIASGSRTRRRRGAGAGHGAPRRRDHRAARAHRPPFVDPGARSSMPGPNIVEIEAGRRSTASSPRSTTAPSSRSTACATSCACCWSPASRMPASAPGATSSSPDANVDLVHFTILRPPEKQDGTPINELSLIAFPTRELFQQKINEFHLIIFDRYARQGVLPIDLFRQHRALCARGRRRCWWRRARLRQPDQHLAHAARRHPAGRAERAHRPSGRSTRASPTSASAIR